MRLFDANLRTANRSDSAWCCLSGAASKAFCFAKTARTRRRGGRLSRTFLPQTPSGERFARCNPSRFEELSVPLTPSNMEGATERPAFCDDSTATEPSFSSCSRRLRVSVFKTPFAVINEAGRFICRLCRPAAFSTKPSFALYRERVV